MSDTQSLVFYLVVFFISTALIYLGNRNVYSKHLRALLVLAGLVIPAIVGGFRYKVGLDYSVYLDIYNGITDRSITDILFDSNGTEVLFGILSYGNSVLFDNPIPLFFAYGLATTSFFYAGIKKLNVRHPWLLYGLFLLVIFPLSFNIMKQALSVSIVFFALSCAMNREVRKGVAWTLFAILSHMSAAIALPFVLMVSVWQKSLATKPITKVIIRYASFLMALGVAFYLGAPYLLDNNVIDKYSTLYGDGGIYASSEASPTRIVLKLLVIGVILMFSRRLYRSREKNQFNLLFLFVLSELVLLLIGLGSAPISRVSLYLLPYSLVILVYIPDLFRRGLSKHIATVCIMMFGILYFVLLYYMQGGSGIFPYDFWAGRL